MARRACFLVAALSALTGVAAAAVTDGDDSKSRVDIARARAAFDKSHDRLAHIIRFHGAISPRNFRNAVAEHGPPGSVCVEIWTKRTPWEASPNYEVCVSADRARKNLVASVSRISAHGAVRRAGNASAVLRSPRRLFIRFDPDDIGRPHAYRWSIAVTTFERGCTQSGCQDVAPPRGHSVRMRLQG